MYKGEKMERGEEGLQNVSNICKVYCLVVAYSKTLTDDKQIELCSQMFCLPTVFDVFVCALRLCTSRSFQNITIVWGIIQLGTFILIQS